MTVRAAPDFPPKPVLALTIGVTGHRLSRPANGSSGERVAAFDPSALRTAIDRVLGQIKSAVEDSRESFPDLFDDAEPIITIVSALGEGADRIVAEAALARRMPLDVVLPCPRADYEATFEDDISRAEFDALLAASRARLALPMPAGPNALGVPPEKRRAATLEMAYEIGGLTILGQADVLIAVWDQQPARGRGGTGGIVDEAARQGTPIIVVDPAGAPPHLRWHASRQFPISAQHAIDLPIADLEEGLGPVIRGLTGPPDSKEEQDGLREYYKSPVARRKGKAAQDAAARPSNDRVAARLLATFETADEVAKRCASDFRWTYRQNFVLGFLTVVMVTASMAIPMALQKKEDWQEFAHQAGAFFAAAEIVCVFWIVVTAAIAEHRELRQRWAEARELAERLRVAEPFWMMGVWPHNLASYQPAWTGWYMRAILREQPVFSTQGVINVRDAKRALREKIEDQRRYYADTERRVKRRDTLLKKGGRFLVGISLLVAFLEVCSVLSHVTVDDGSRAAMVSVSIMLPALATTFFGIRLVGDTEDIARRAARSRELLEALENRLNDDLDDLQILRGRARAAAAAMLADVASWRIALQSRSIPDG